MANISALSKRAFVTWAWISAPEGADTFRTFIEALLVARMEVTASGRIVVNTSSAGHSVTFTLPSLPKGRIETPEEIAQLCQEILEIYDTHFNGQSEDDQLRQNILDDDRLRSATSFRPDFSVPRAGQFFS